MSAEERLFKLSFLANATHLGSRDTAHKQTLLPGMPFFEFFMRRARLFKLSFLLNATHIEEEHCP